MGFSRQEYWSGVPSPSPGKGTRSHIPELRPSAAKKPPKYVNVQKAPVSLKLVAVQSKLAYFTSSLSKLFENFDYHHVIFLGYKNH